MKNSTLQEDGVLQSLQIKYGNLYFKASRSVVYFPIWIIPKFNSIKRTCGGNRLGANDFLLLICKVVTGWGKNKFTLVRIGSFLCKVSKSPAKILNCRIG